MALPILFNSPSSGRQTSRDSFVPSHAFSQDSDHSPAFHLCDCNNPFTAKSLVCLTLSIPVSFRLHPPTSTHLSTRLKWFSVAYTTTHKHQHQIHRTLLDRKLFLPFQLCPSSCPQPQLSPVILGGHAFSSSHIQVFFQKAPPPTPHPNCGSDTQRLQDRVTHDTLSVPVALRRWHSTQLTPQHLVLSVVVSSAFRTCSTKSRNSLTAQFSFNSETGPASTRGTQECSVESIHK